MNDYFSFRKMLTPVIIKILYIAGSVGIIVTTFVFMVKVIDFSASLGFFSSLGILISGAFGFLVWRMLCEYIILSFSLHDELVKFHNDYSVCGHSPLNPQPAPSSAYEPPAQDAGKDTVN